MEEPASSQLNPALGRRAQLRVVAAVVLALLLGFGGYQIYGYLTDRPKSPDQVKRQIARFLKKQTGRDNFVTSVPTGITNDLVFERRRGATDRDRNDRGRRRNLDRPPTVNALQEHRKRMETAGDYKSIYIAIGEELWMAEQLLESKDALERQVGLLIAAEAEYSALNNAISPWLAARIAEAYLWPGVELAEASQIRGLNPETVLQVSDNAFQQAGETNNVIRNYKYLLNKSSNSNRADMARVRLAGIYEDMGDLEEALEHLTKVQNTNNNFVQRRIATLRQRIKQQ